MCGITGFLELPQDRHSSDSGAVLLEQMARALERRGPDDGGVWADPERGIGLGFRRLAIIDLSRSGSQPMLSRDGRYVVVFNGEVYNHGELRRELERRGHRFRGRSDTEALVEAIAQWGVRDAVLRCHGMFAIAAWDRATDTLSLVRDRLGKKPLYWGWAAGTLVFASELKALHRHPQFRPQIDRAALRDYLRYGYVPAPRTIFSEVFKPAPGSIVEVSRASGVSEARPYWSLRDVAQGGIDERFAGSPTNALDELERVLGDSVTARMVADVPLGAFLSGGTDSSLVVALMQARSPLPVQTFTIGFTEAGYDEATWARAVATSLGTNHTELYVSPSEAQGVIPELPRIYDEPLADSSQIPTVLVSRLARREVTVSLSGDGGDELFGGYGRYRLASRAWSAVNRVPRIARPPAASLLAAAGSCSRLWPADRLGRARRSSLPDRARRLAALITARDRDALYDEIVSLWSDPAPVVGLDAPSRPDSHQELSDGGSFLEAMMYRDAVTYLPDDILAKVDRASMDASLEVRNPLLDHRVVELAWSLPPALKLRDGRGKWPLRALLSRHLPDELVERPKQGFDVPLGAWLRGPLRKWAESLLSAERLRDEGHLEVAPVRAAWDEHLRGAHDHRHTLWAVLMFEAWLEAW
ncbi:MAG: asparagine synthase (glutamine-hydrolyzing) [Solirubrobacterales bacterium]|nr:MAG: asparagine synthase (glutamine-hydrolyzing) [Solirubrobacterales bacterium]